MDLQGFVLKYTLNRYKLLNALGFHPNITMNTVI